MLAFWAAPQMSVGRLIFALGMTAYILAALCLALRTAEIPYGGT